MNLFLAVIITFQANPDDALKKMVEAVESRDVTLLKKIMADETGASRLTSDIFDQWIATAKEDSKGHYREALKAKPILGEVHPSVKSIKLEYIRPVSDGIIRTEIELEKMDGVWKIDELEFKWRDYKLEGDLSLAEIPPGKVFQAIVSAAGKGSYEKIMDRLPEKLREVATSEMIEDMIKKEEDKLEGKWLSTLEMFPRIREGELPLAGLEVEITLPVNGEDVRVSVELVKEKGAWFMSDLDTRLKTQPDDSRPDVEPRPGPESQPDKDPR